MKLMNLLKEEQDVNVDNPLNGMSNGQARNFIHRKLNTQSVSTKLYSDESWQPIQSWFKQLHDLKIDFGITKSEYRRENGIPTAKIWAIEIYYRSAAKIHTLYGRIVAAGAGSVENPLEKYDVVFSLS